MYNSGYAIHYEFDIVHEANIELNLQGIELKYENGFYGYGVYVTVASRGRCV